MFFILQIFLGLGKWMSKEVWNITKTVSDSKFVVAICKCIWGDRVLVNMALDLKRTRLRLRDRSPRRQFTPEEITHIKSK